MNSLYFYNWKLDKGKKKVEIRMIYHRKCCTFWYNLFKKGYADIPIDVKQSDGNAIFISLMLLPFEYKSIVSCLWSIQYE